MFTTCCINLTVFFLQISVGGSSHHNEQEIMQDVQDMYKAPYIWYVNIRPKCL